jgi:hypothetical protein
VITRTEFDVLPTVEKAYTLFELGDELDVREEGDFRIKLYLISDFFVELWFGKSNEQSTKLISLSEDDVLNIYGERIDISQI